MLEVVSPISVKGIREDVLEALQFVVEGQGILAGLAIFFYTLIIGRIVANNN